MPRDDTGIGYYTIKSFHSSNGVTNDVKIAYRSFNPSSTKGAVLIPTCALFLQLQQSTPTDILNIGFGGRINTTLNFTNGALKDYHVIVVAMLGNGESSSPSNDDKFPADYSLRYEDCINSQYALVTQHLGIKSLEAVIGFSMGGQQAYYWSVMHGTGSNPFLKRSVVICGSAKTSGHNFAFLEGPITALLESHDYDHGNYKRNGLNPTAGLKAFNRAYAAWLTSAAWFRQELWREQGKKSLDEWLKDNDDDDGWDAEDLLTLARMWQAGDVGKLDESGDYRKALGKVTAKVLVMPCVSDQYFPSEDGEEEAKYLNNGRFNPIQSVWGHVAGGGGSSADREWMDREIATFMEE